MGRLRRGLVVSWAVAACLFYWLASSVRPAPPDPARINVRWSAEVGPEQRAVLARRYRLSDPLHRGEGAGDRSRAGRTWSYQILDTSVDNVRLLVQDPAVEDTSEVDRTNFRVEGAPPGGSASRWPPAWVLLIASGLAGIAVVRMPAGLAAASRFTRRRWHTETWQGRFVVRLRHAPWVLWAAAGPSVAVALMTSVWLVEAAFDRHPFWRTATVTLSEAAARRDAGEVGRLLLAGQDPNARYPVRAGVLGDAPVVLTPIEAAIAANHPEIVAILRHGGAVLPSLPEDAPPPASR